MKLVQLDEESVRTLVKQTEVKSFLCKRKIKPSRHPVVASDFAYFVAVPFSIDAKILWFDDAAGKRCYQFHELEAVFEILEDWE